MSPFLKLVLGLLGVVVAGVAGVVGVGLLLPKEHQARRSLKLRRPPRAVWETLTDVDGYSSWRTDLDRVERLPDVGGHKRWKEHGKSGVVTFEMVQAKPTTRMVTRIADLKLPFGGTWTYELEGSSEGCTLTVTEDGEIKNPLLRFLARFVFGYSGTIDAYVAALEKKLGGLSG